MLSTRVAHPPTHSGAKSSKTETSNAIELAKSTLLSSSLENAFCVHAMKAATLPCSMTTPLGLPVEPDV